MQNTKAARAEVVLENRAIVVETGDVDYVEVDEARSLGGLRLVLSVGVPNLLGEAAKAIFHVKRLAYVAVAQHVMQPNKALLAWTGYRNAPLAVWNDETARGRWYEILLLAERLAPEPRLVPVDRAERALAMGLSNELVGEDGYAWNSRFLMFPEEAAGLKDQGSAMSHYMKNSYGGSPESVAAANAKTVAILQMLAERLLRQRDAGSRYFVGTTLSAVDIYWTLLSIPVAPVSNHRCATPRAAQECWDRLLAVLGGHVHPLLIEHRNWIWNAFLPERLDFESARGDCSE